MIREKVFSIALLSALVNGTAIAHDIPQFGSFGVGYERFDADPSRKEMLTSVWYPTIAGAEGNSSIYPWRGWTYESPFFGVTDSDPSEGSFPLVVLSHGAGAWGDQFAHIGESLASHGYVVAAPYHSTNEIGTRATELNLAVDTMLERNQAEEDKLQGVINRESIALGGYSWGSPTTAAALETRSDVDAILLIDASDARMTGDMPVMHVGGGDHFFNTVSLRIERADFYSLDVGTGSRDVRAHHWSYGLNGCQFRDNLLEAARAAGATERELRSAVQPDSFWLGCNPAYIPPTEVQQRMNVHSVAFLDSVLKAEQGEGWRHVLAPEEHTTAADLWLNVEVDRGRVSVMLTDPEGRRLGLDEMTREEIDDFDNQGLGNVSRARRRLLFGLPSEVLTTGQYTLMITGSEPEDGQNYTVKLGAASLRGDDIIYSQSRISMGTIEAENMNDPIHFSISSPPIVDVVSIDALFGAILDGNFEGGYDLSADGFLDHDDIQYWVERIQETYFGDSNLDGEFNSGDLVEIFAAGEYEDGVAMNSTWATGDWNGDAEFDTGDLVLAFQSGGFEQGPRDSRNAVPEPSGLILLLVGCLALNRTRNR